MHIDVGCQIYITCDVMYPDNIINGPKNAVTVKSLYIPT